MSTFNDLVNEGFVSLTNDGHLPKFLKPEEIDGVFYNCGRKLLFDKDGQKVMDRFKKTEQSWGHKVLNSATGEFHLLPQQKAYTETLDADTELGAKLYKISFKGTTAMPNGQTFNRYNVAVKELPKEQQLTAEQMSA